MAAPWPGPGRQVHVLWLLKWVHSLYQRHRTPEEHLICVYITIRVGCEVICKITPCSENLAAAVALLMAKLLRLALRRLPTITIAHSAVVSDPCCLWGAVKGGILCCKDSRFAPRTMHYESARSLSAFPKRQHGKETPELGKHCLFPVCVSQFRVWGGRREVAKTES